ncbi:hypothetical protein KXV85_004376, partial [Aspergillus fumigatus]
PPSARVSPAGGTGGGGYWGFDATTRRQDKSAAPSLVVPRHGGQLVQILQQDAAALQVQDAVLAPELELAVDALAGGADEDAELLLGNVNLGTEIGSQRAEAAGEAHRQRLQHGFLHALALPADALAQQHDDLDGDLGLTFEEAQKILTAEHEQFRGFAGGGVGAAALA